MNAPVPRSARSVPGVSSFVWRGEGRRIWREEQEGAFTLFGFRVTTCPQYDDATTSDGQIDISHLRQKVFFDSIGALLSNHCDAAIEMRARAMSGRAEVDFALMIRLRTEAPLDARVATELMVSVRSMLPPDHEYEPLLGADLDSFLSLPDGCAVTNVRKPIAWMPVGEMTSALGRNRLPPVMDTRDVQCDTEPGVGIAYSAPGIPYLVGNTNNWLTLWRVLQEVSRWEPGSDGQPCPVVLRISAARAHVFPFERAYANQLLLLMQRTYSDGAPEDSSEFKSLRKYARPESLSTLQIQIAGGNTTIVQSLGHVLAGEITFGAPNRLVCDPVQPRFLSAVRRDWAFCRHTSPDDLPEMDEVECKDDGIRAFLLRAPFLLDDMEAACIMRLPVGGVEGLPGICTRPPKPFHQPSPERAPVTSNGSLVCEGARKGLISLGRLIVNNQERDPYRFPLNDLAMHALIVGSTGAGKTNSALNLLLELSCRQSPVPFLVIEPVKGEYGPCLERMEMVPEAVPKVYQYHLRSPWYHDGERKGLCDPTFLRFNPLAVPETITVAQHISYIKGCLCAAFPMYGAMPMVLELGLRDLYRLHGFRLFDQGVVNASRDPRWPTLLGLHGAIERYVGTIEHKETRDALRDMFLRRFEFLLEGPLGYALTPEKWHDENTDGGQICTNVPDAPSDERYQFPLDVLLNRPTLIGLEALADNEEKALVMAFLLTLLYEHRVAQGTSPLRHVTVIEEAHRLLNNAGVSARSSGPEGNQSEDSRTRTANLFMDMLAEIRAYGEGIVVVEQVPTKVLPDVIKNTNLKVMHRITSADERSYLGGAMRFDEQQYSFVSTLRRGEAVVFEENLDHPVIVRVPQVKK